MHTRGGASSQMNELSGREPLGTKLVLKKATHWHNSSVEHREIERGYTQRIIREGKLFVLRWTEQLFYCSPPINTCLKLVQVNAQRFFSRRDEVFSHLLPRSLWDMRNLFMTTIEISRRRTSSRLNIARFFTRPGVSDELKPRTLYRRDPVNRSYCNLVLYCNRSLVFLTETGSQLLTVASQGRLKKVTGDV